jgi:hypothetical protein
MGIYERRRLIFNMGQFDAAELLSAGFQIEPDIPTFMPTWERLISFWSPLRRM